MKKSLIYLSFFSVISLVSCGEISSFSSSTSKESTSVSSSPIKHTFADPEFIWSDDMTACEALFQCQNEEEHIEKIECDINSKRVDPTCETNGECTYTATAVFEGVTYTDEEVITLPAIGHNYHAEFNWSEDYTSAECILTCLNDSSHVIKRIATITTSEEEATCTEEGQKVYTATVYYEDQIYEDTREVIISALGHEYQFDNTCSRCGSLMPYSEGLSFELASDSSSYILSSYTGDDEEVLLPNSYGGLAITEIKDRVFYGNSVIKSVRLPKTIEKIGERAFQNCSLLEKINLEDTSMIEIGNFAFSRCTNLKEVILPETVTTIRQKAFNNAGVKSLHLPADLQNIEISAFSGCTLDSLTMSETQNTKYYLSNDCLIDATKFAGYLVVIGVNKENVVIPNDITKLRIIGDYAFYNCDKLKNISLANTIQNINESAFAKCTSLTQIVMPVTINQIADDAFSESALKDVFYRGTKDLWTDVTGYDSITAAVHYYSETEPIDNTESYWHYVNNTPTIW